MGSYDSDSQIIRMKQIQEEGLELFIKKNADYGNSYKQYGLIGILVRVQDKINRALNITKNGIRVQDESLRDTLIDLHNYAAMALMESEPTLPIIGMNEISMPTVLRSSIDEFMNQPIDQSMNQPIDQSMNQIVDQSMNQT